MLESFLYMELPFDYISLEFDSYLDKPEEIKYRGSSGNEIILEISHIIEPHFKDYFQTSFQKLIPELIIIELFTIKSPNLALYILVFKIEIKLSSSEYLIDELINKLLKWFAIIFDFYPEVPRLERIITNIPITKIITDKMVGHFISLFSDKKIKSLRMADYNFKSFISEFPRLSNSNILSKFYKKLKDYYDNLFMDYRISLHPFNFYGYIREQAGSNYISLFKELTGEFHSYLISLYAFIGEDMENFLILLESFRYKMSPLEFVKLIEYEQYFEEISEIYFSNEITKWCREKFEIWVFENYKDKDFYLYQPSMIYRLPCFPKTYLKLRVRIQEILNNTKHLLLSKSKTSNILKRAEILKKFFPFLKPISTFKQEIGQKEHSVLQVKLEKIKEKCAQGISKEDCENCLLSSSKICLTKLFSHSLGKEVLPHCGAELADCYWISENEGNALVLKATNMNTKTQYADAFMQITDLAQLSTVKIIFFANTKSTSNQFLSKALFICKSSNKQFLPFNKDELIQFLHFYEETTSQSKENAEEKAEDKLLIEIKRLGLDEINNFKKFEKDADRYERALFNFLIYEYPPPEYIVLFDHKLQGKGEIERKLKVAVFKAQNFKKPFILGECIRFTTKEIQINIADFIAGMKEHVDASYAVLATSKEFSIDAIKRANLSNVVTLIIDLEDADRLNWREIAREYFPWDKNFQPVIADALYEFANLPENTTPSEDDYWKVIDAMENIPYEEWRAFFDNAKNVNLNYYNLLYFIAMRHYDSGWRFNAIQYLEGWLDKEKLISLLEHERDEETIELIKEQLKWLK